MAAEAPKRMMGNGVSEEASVVHVRNWRHSVAEEVSPKNPQKTFRNRGSKDVHSEGYKGSIGTTQPLELSEPSQFCFSKGPADPSVL